MSRKIIGVSLCVLILLSIIQIIIDCRSETENSNAVISAARRPEYVIFIEVEDKTLYLLEDGACIKKYPIASGKSGYPSPIGYWKITTKEKWGEGFGGRWMGLNVPWGEYGIHGTNKPGSIGSAASQGCIRMFSDDVKELYDIVPLGTRVVIVNGLFGPFGRGFANIEPGDRGADVMEIQRRLKDLGYFKGWLSGVYEDDLKNAVHRFQKDKGLPVINTITRECWEAMGFREFE
ncbi:MAG TPA: L,D-transpeptidase family protein [Clostridiales bacterium]|nr:L,D-transpeptidase family protein [Clostridiales bacterium]